MVPDDFRKLNSTKSPPDICAATTRDNYAWILNGEFLEQPSRAGQNRSLVRLRGDRRERSIKVESQEHVPGGKLLEI
jgi:hypothetical protein